MINSISSIAIHMEDHDATAFLIDTVALVCPPTARTRGKDRKKIYGVLQEVYRVEHSSRKSTAWSLFLPEVIRAGFVVVVSHHDTRAEELCKR